MQGRAKALTSETQKALHRLGLEGKIGYTGSGRWKLRKYCSEDLFLDVQG